MSSKEMSAILLLTAGVVMAFTSLFLPPLGVVDDSVIYIFAQILVYAGTIFGVGAYVDNKIQELKSIRNETRNEKQMERDN